MKQLIPFIREEMKSCPSENFIFNLIETVDFYSLKRYFKFKSNSNMNHSEEPKITQEQRSGIDPSTEFGSKIFFKLKT